MFAKFVAFSIAASLALAISPEARCQNDFRNSDEETRSTRPDATQIAESMAAEIVSWLSSNFDLPAIKIPPRIEFASRAKLARVRAEDRAPWQGFTQDEGDDRTVVSLYDNNSRTVILPDDWTGKSPVEQSVLVHEMVHHLQKMGDLKFECPMARERLAYDAQDKWLKRFGTSLEREFDVDMFTILISSACM